MSSSEQHAPAATPTFNQTVYFEVDGRTVSGTVRSTCTGGGFNEVVVFSPDLGHTHRIDDGVRVQIDDLLPAPNPDEDARRWTREKAGPGYLERTGYSTSD